MRDLYLEGDPLDVSIQDIIDRGGANAAMVLEAQRLGMRIHLYDDRSIQRERAERYPEESAFFTRAWQNDPTMSYEALIQSAPNPERMRAFLAERQEHEQRDMDFRNERMADNIDTEMRQHPGDKAIVIVGADHANGHGDLDEGLRERGHRTTTVEVRTQDSAYIGMETAAASSDRPDFVLQAESMNEVASYKEPGTNAMRMALQGIELPWRNTEPVQNAPESDLFTLNPAATEVVPPRTEERAR